MQIDLFVLKGQQRFGQITEGVHVPLGGFVLLTHEGEEVHAHDDVLTGRDDRVAVGWREDVVRREHQDVCFRLRFEGQWQVDGHLVAVEVGVVAGADQRMQRDGVAFDENWLEGLDTHAVQRRRAVEQDRVLVDDLLKDVPYLGIAPLQHPLGRLDRIGEPVFLEFADDEGLVEFKRDLLGEAALMEFEFRPHDDDGSGRVVDPLAE